MTQLNNETFVFCLGVRRKINFFIFPIFVWLSIRILFRWNNIQSLVCIVGLYICCLYCEMEMGKEIRPRPIRVSALERIIKQPWARFFFISFFRSLSGCITTKRTELSNNIIPKKMDRKRRRKNLYKIFPSAAVVYYAFCRAKTVCMCVYCEKFAQPH